MVREHDGYAGLLCYRASIGTKNIPCFCRYNAAFHIGTLAGIPIRIHGEGVNARSHIRCQRALAVTHTPRSFTAVLPLWAVCKIFIGARCAMCSAHVTGRPLLSAAFSLFPRVDVLRVRLCVSHVHPRRADSSM